MLRCQLIESLLKIREDYCNVLVLPIVRLKLAVLELCRQLISYLNALKVLKVLLAVTVFKKSQNWISCFRFGRLGPSVNVNEFVWSPEVCVSGNINCLRRHIC